MDDMSCDDGLSLGNVFCKAFSGGDRCFERKVAVRTMGEGVDLGFIDPFGGSSTDPFMALFPTWPFLSPFSRRLLIGSLHPRGSGRVVLRMLPCKRFLEFLYPGIELQEFCHCGLFARTV